MGLESMKMNRPVKRDRDLTSGPGKLTLALDIDRSLNGQSTTDATCEIHVLDNEYEFEMGASHRIGVQKIYRSISGSTSKTIDLCQNREGLALPLDDGACLLQCGEFFLGFAQLLG